MDCKKLWSKQKGFAYNQPSDESDPGLGKNYLDMVKRTYIGLPD